MSDGIPGTCPDCGSQRPLQDYLADTQARAALGAALDCPRELASLIVPYIALHAPPRRRMRWDKLTRLLRELADGIAAGTIRRDGDTWPAPPDLWRRGIEAVLAARDAGTLELPLDGHGYLLGCMVRQAKRDSVQSARSSAPTHASHLPAATPSPDTPSDPAAERQELISDRRALLTLLDKAGPDAAARFRTRIATIDARLRELGIRLPPPGGPDR